MERWAEDEDYGYSVENEADNGETNEQEDYEDEVEFNVKKEDEKEEEDIVDDPDTVISLSDGEQSVANTTVIFSQNDGHAESNLDQLSQQPSKEHVFFDDETEDDDDDEYDEDDDNPTDDDHELKEQTFNTHEGKSSTAPYYGLTGPPEETTELAGLKKSLEEQNQLLFSMFGKIMDLTETMATLKETVDHILTKVDAGSSSTTDSAIATTDTT